MKLISKEKNNYLIRFDRGEYLFENLKKFCQDKKVYSAFFYGLGAVDFAKLGYYNLRSKKYRNKIFKKSFEIASLTGNISLHKDEIIIHAHGVFSDPGFKAVAGHVDDEKIAVTAEMYLVSLGSKVRRKYNPDIGLNLLV